LKIFDENSVWSCAGATVETSVVGGTAVGAGIAAGAQAVSNILTSINTETSNFRVFIFSPLVNYF